MLKFANVYECLDAIMLAGARIEPGQGYPASGRLIVARNKKSARLISWLVMLLGQHDVEMSLKVSEKRLSDRLEFASVQVPFLTSPMQRWYEQRDGSRVTVLPDDLEITEAMFCVWLANGLAVQRSRRWRATRLVSTVATSIQADRAIQQIESLATPMKFTPGRSADNRLVIDVDDQTVAETWLSERLPCSIWEPVDPLEI